MPGSSASGSGRLRRRRGAAPAGRAAARALAARTPPPRTTLESAPVDPRESRPNPRYLFETFVVGASNHFAFAAAQAVAANPGHV